MNRKIFNKALVSFEHDEWLNHGKPPEFMASCHHFISSFDPVRSLYPVFAEGKGMPTKPNQREYWIAPVSPFFRYKPDQKKKQNARLRVNFRTNIYSNMSSSACMLCMLVLAAAERRFRLRSYRSPAHAHATNAHWLVMDDLAVKLPAIAGFHARRKLFKYAVVWDIYL